MSPSAVEGAQPAPGEQDRRRREQAEHDEGGSQVEGVDDDRGEQRAQAHGEPSFETAFSGRDLILIAGGLFLLWKATKEIHHNLDPELESGELLDPDKGVAQIAFGAAIGLVAGFLVLALIAGSGS